ncbi:MAG: sugar ABC transporter permease [Pelolinea sp.]|jgi:multiple sugar transport system permease protein|nr:sugar ABC transporter permease [Pelolinea sp.]
MKQRFVSRSQRGNALAYHMIFPTWLTIVVVHFIPISIGIFISFRNLTRYNISNILSTNFVGFENYYKSLYSMKSDFLSSLSVTIVFVIFTVIISYLLGLACALIGNSKFKGRTIFRGLMLIPLIIPSVVSLTCLRFMFQQNGIINYLLQQVHFVTDPIVWLVGKNTFYVILIGNIWIRWPLYFSVLLSGMQAISEELYEAASMDGAGFFQKLLFITLPALKENTFITTILIAIWSFNDFNVPYIMLGGGYTAVPDAANLVAINIYRKAFFSLDFSYAAAQSILMSLLSLSLILIYLQLRKKED